MNLSRLWLAIAILPTVLATKQALADVPPPDICSIDASVGQSCENAMDSQGGYSAAGTCQSTMCSRVGPTADGGISTTQYACIQCVPSDGGTSSSGITGSSGSGGVSGSSGSPQADASASGSSSGSPSTSGGGCTVGGVRAETLAPFALMGAGAVLVGLSRRRRQDR